MPGIEDKNRVFDGFSGLPGGVDNGRVPNLIDKDQCHDAENVQFRGALPDNRPPFRTMTTVFENPNLTYNADGTFLTETGVGPQGQVRFHYGILQEASYYNPSPGKEFFMCSIAGRLYRISIGEDTATVREIALLKRNRENIPLNYHVQAAEFFVAQDGESLPIIFDGVNVRRSTPDEIPVGTVMAYGLGRIVLVRGPFVEFGNIYDGKGGGGGDVLGWDENSFLNEGFPSAIPPQMGTPTAIAFLPQQDTATGVGECLVFGQTGIESFFLSIPREQWKDSVFQRTALLGSGTYGHRSLTAVNGDIYFRASDGWRSYRQARAEQNTWAQIPLSTNVKRYIDSDTENWLKFGSAIHFDNRLLATSNPVPNANPAAILAFDRPYHNGILSLDFDVLSTFGRTRNPAWDGRWLNKDLHSLKVVRLLNGTFNGRKRMFAFVLGPGDALELVEILKEGIRDTDGPIASHLISRSMDCDLEFNEKNLYGGDVWVDQVFETTFLICRYRPDQTGDFQSWNTFQFDPAGGDPQDITNGGVPTIRKGYWARKQLMQPFENAEVQMNRKISRGFEHQVEFFWTGRLAIRKFRIHAQKEVEQSPAEIT